MKNNIKNRISKRKIKPGTPYQGNRVIAAKRQFCNLDFLFLIFAFSMGLSASMGLAAPQPATVPSPRHWTIDVTFEHPQQIVLQTGTNNKPRRFWYVIITLTNKTGRDVDFYPKCELMTDTFQVIPAGKDIPLVAFEQIKRRHHSSYPFLKSLENSGNKILQGQDNAKDIAIIWPDFDARANGINLFIAGLSNETVAINHPVTKDKNDNPVKVFLRKTLELNYTLGGDPVFRSDARLVYKHRRWIMR